MFSWYHFFLFYFPLQIGYLILQWVYIWIRISCLHWQSYLRKHKIFQPWQKTSKYLAELIMVQCFRVDVCIVWFCCLLDGIWCSLSIQKGVDPEIMVSKISSSSLQVELCSCHIINHLSIFSQSLDSMFYIVSKWLPEF